MIINSDKKIGYKIRLNMIPLKEEYIPTTVNQNNLELTYSEDDFKKLKEKYEDLYEQYLKIPHDILQLIEVTFTMGEIVIASHTNIFASAAIEHLYNKTQKIHSKPAKAPKTANPSKDVMIQAILKQNPLYNKTALKRATIDTILDLYEKL